jgi:hypothetical protein
MAVTRKAPDPGKDPSLLPPELGGTYQEPGGAAPPLDFGMTEAPTAGEPSYGDEGSSERPRDRYPQMPTTPVAPGGVPRPGLPGEGAQATPPPMDWSLPAEPMAPSVPDYAMPETGLAGKPMVKPGAPDAALGAAPPAPPESTSAPDMPDYPSPVAEEPAKPIPGYTPPAGIVRKGLTGAPSLPSSKLLGQAGGLLGGGLGVPSLTGSGSDVSALIQQLLKQGRG